jgi:transcriptional regulator with XRE-family HTH domain
MQRKTIENAELAADIRSAQSVHGISDQKLARVAGVSRRALGDVKRGYNVTVKTVKLLMKALQMRTIRLGDDLNASGPGAFEGINPEVLRMTADALEQAIAPVIEQIAILRAYSKGESSVELNAEARELVHSSTEEAKLRPEQRRRERRK